MTALISPVTFTSTTLVTKFIIAVCNRYSLKDAIAAGCSLRRSLYLDKSLYKNPASVFVHLMEKHGCKLLKLCSRSYLYMQGICACLITADFYKTHSLHQQILLGRVCLGWCNQWRAMSSLWETSQ